MRRWYTRMSAVVLSAAMIISALPPVTVKAGVEGQGIQTLEMDSRLAEGEESVLVAEVNGGKYASLQSAVDSVADGQSAKITVLGDVELTSSVQITGGKNITFMVPEKENYVIKRADGYHGSLFTVMKNSTLSLGTQVKEQSGVLTLDGGASWKKTVNNNDNGDVFYIEAEGPTDEEVVNQGLVSDKALIELTAGYFFLYENAVLQNNDNQSATGSGAIDSTAGGNGHIKIYGKVLDNRSKGGAGGIRANCYVDIYESALFEDNCSEKNGGALEIYGGGVTEENKGTYRGNVAKGNGGAVSVDGKMNLYEGVYERNRAAKGGALYIQSASKSRMADIRGAEFKDNLAEQGNDIYQATIYARYQGELMISDIYLPEGITLNVNGVITGQVGVSGPVSKEEILAAQGADNYILTKKDADRILASQMYESMLFRDGKVYRIHRSIAITGQPSGIGVVNIGDEAKLTVQAQSENAGVITYQWYQCEDGQGNNAQKIDGAEDSEFTVPTDRDGTFYFYCVVGDGEQESVSSDIVSVIVVDPDLAKVPEIKVQPQSGIYDVGETITPLEVEASAKDGGVLTYQWYESQSKELDGAEAIPGADKASYQPESRMGDIYYYVEVTNHGPGSGKKPVSVNSETVCISVGNYEARIGKKVYSRFSEAVVSAKTGEEVRLLKDIFPSEGIVAQNKEISINGQGHVIGRNSENAANALFRVAGGKVSVRNMILDGGAVWEGEEDESLKRGNTNTGLSARNALILVENATLTIASDVILRNNDNKNATYRVSGGAMQVTGNNSRIQFAGTMKDNASAAWGGAVMQTDNGQFIFDGGEVSGNQAGNSGAAFCMDHQSVLMINGGEIHNNKSSAEGGAVWISKGKAIFNSGKIQENQSRSGNLIYVKDTGSVEIGSIKAENTDSVQKPGIIVNSGSVSVNGKPEIDDVIALPAGTLVSVKSDFAGEHTIGIKPQTISQNGAKIAHADTEVLAKAAADVFKVDGFSCYAGYEDYENVTPGALKTSVYYGPSVEIKITENLVQEMTAMEGRPLSLSVEATIEPEKDEYTFPVYHWYSCSDKEGNNAKLLAEGKDENVFKSTSHKKGTRYYFCEVTSSRYGAKPVRSEVVKVQVAAFYPASLAIAKFDQILDYGLKIEKITTKDEKGESCYFDKQEKIKVAFTSINTAGLTAKKAQINGQQYDLAQTESGQYEAIIDGFKTQGVKKIRIEKLWMDNGRVLTVQGGKIAEVEILKTAPFVESFAYAVTEDENGKRYLTVTFELKDEDDAFKKGKLSVVDAEGTEIGNVEITHKGEQQFTVPLTSGISYTVEVFADYDLDSDTLTQGDNEYQNVKLLVRAVSAVSGQIEFKDIESVELYRNNNGTVEKVEEVSVADFRPEEYIAKIKMRELPVFYSEIESYSVKDDSTFWLTLKYDYAVHYEDGEKQDRAEVKFGNVTDGIAFSMGFARLIETIKSNPFAQISLTMDLDANDISVSSETYLGDFQGTIHGNGYTIKNLKKPLFESLKNATVENLVLDNANVSNDQGILANQASDSLISNVHVRNSSLETKGNEAGGFIGNAGSNTKIEQCSANNVSVRGAKFVGGFVGRIGAGALISNSYIKGKVTATNDAAGGIIGQSDGNTILRNSYADIDFQMTVNYAVGGLIGYSSGSQVILQNNISLADGPRGAKIIGSTSSYQNSSSNNYELKESKLSSNANGNQVKTISGIDINKTFFTEVLQWDDTIWSLDGANTDQMPALKNADPAYSEKNISNEELENEGLHIPNIDRLRHMEEYDETRKIAYHNVNKLIPFYDSAYIVEYGNQIPKDSLLNTQKIKHIFAYDKKGKLVTGLNSDTYQDLSGLKLIFDNNEEQYFTLTFFKKMEDIAVYTIDELGVGYMFDQFILNLENPIVGQILEKAKALDYKTQIASVTPEDESRLYVDYYNQSVKSRIEEIVLQMLESEGEYNLYLDNEIVYAKMRQMMFENKELEKLIYTYNYFDKWYHVKVGDVTLTEAVFLNIQHINPSIGIKNLVDATLAQSQSNRATDKPTAFYNSVIKPALQMDIGSYYDHFVKIMTGYKNPADWFTDQFQGILWEKPMEGGVKYRAWDLMKSNTNLMATILSAPQEQMYMIAVPSQIFIGSRNVYYNKTDEQLVKDVDTFAQRVWNFYNTSRSWITNSTSILNSKIQVEFDTRFGFKNGDQNAGTTEDPVIKWVYESLGAMAAYNSSGAYANGDYVYWVRNKCLYNVKVFSHETAHNQDGYYFYEGYGRRSGTRAEDHADGNIAQEDVDRYTYIFNLTRDQDLASDTTENLRLSSIMGKEKIATYYKEMFETKYVLDYLIGQAFLRLSPQDQAKIAVKATYPQGGNYNTGGGTVEYSYLTMQDFMKMDLKDMEDLWDNGLCLTDQRVTNASGEYQGDNYKSVYWYQPHNDNGRPDSWSFKILGFEMLGVGGYSDGYVTYRSGKSQNDLDALRKITGNPDITWKQYKMDRYKHVEENLSKISYFNAEDVIQAFVETLQKDAKIDSAMDDRRRNSDALRNVLFGVVKRATKDFQEGSIYSDEQIQISTAQEFIDAMSSNEWGDYVLTADLDFQNVQTEENAYVTKRFIGRLDGNGHTIRGLEKPLFQNIVYAQMQDLTVETNGMPTAFLAEQARNTVINNIFTLNNPEGIPLVKNNTGGIVNLGANQIDTSEGIKISSVEDFKNIKDGTKTYTLTQDIDMSSLTDKNTIISGDFSGTFNGNGYTLKNLKAPLFETLKGTVKNLKIENADIDYANIDQAALLILHASNAVVEDIRINGAKITAKYTVGGLVCDSASSIYNNISMENLEIQTQPGGYLCAGFSATSGNDTVSDIIVSGHIVMNAMGNGGMFGSVGGGEINRAYVNVDMSRAEGISTYYDGGLYGIGSTYGNVKVNIKNTLVVGDVPKDVYKIAPSTDSGLKDVVNVYEYEGSTGNSNAQSSANIKLATEINVKDPEFYTDILIWSADIWDFSRVTAGEKPVLK